MLISALSAIILATNLEITVRNLDKTGHPVTIEVQRVLGGGVKTESGWVDAGEERKFERIKNLAHGQSYRVYTTTPNGVEKEIKSGRVDKINDREYAIIPAEDKADEVSVGDVEATSGLVKFLEVEHMSPSDVMSEVDLLQRLGSVMIATKHEDGSFECHAVISLTDDVRPESRTDAYRTSSNMVMNRETMVNLSASAIFASLSMEVGFSNFYSVSWDLTKNWYLNNFDVQQGLIDADATTIQSVYQALAWNPKAEVYAIARFNVIDDMVFTVTSGRRVSSDVDSNIGVFVRGSGLHIFDHREEKIVRINGIAVSVVPAMVSRRNFILDYLDSRISGTKHDLDLEKNSELKNDREAFSRGLVEYEESRIDL